MAQTIPTFQVDAFTAEAFGGNPAAVCLPAEPLDDDTMQKIAAEMNLSETAFVVPRDGGGGAFDLRWFTPLCEVPLCGHATLASAHALWENDVLPHAVAAEFVTVRSGTLGARRGDDGWIELDFPALVCRDAQAPGSVVAALGSVVPKRVVEVPRETYGQECFLAELESEQIVRELAPDLDALRVPGAPGLIVTARADTAGIDFVSRFFAPFVGVDEDPVTGSAHCALAPFWGAALSRRELTGYQASARGGVVGVRWNGDRVGLRGQAVTVLRGEIIL